MTTNLFEDAGEETKPGVLAIWHDCAPGQEDRYEAWYHGEHLLERVSVPGFRSGRRYGAMEGAPAYFTFYETVSPDVLNSAAYRARLDDPTPETQAIMRGGVARNLVRMLGARVSVSGAIRSAVVVTARFERDAPPALASASAPGALRLELWRDAEARAFGTSTEERLRAPDGKIAACLLADAANDAAARAIAAGWRGSYGASAIVGIYRSISTLHRDDIIGL